VTPGIRLRPACAFDSDSLLAWRNDPTTRAVSFEQEEIASSTHARWFAGRLGDPDCLFLVVEKDGAAVGQVRLERLAPGLAEVNIGLASEARGRGIGRHALQLAADEARRQLGIETLRALVRRENEPSLRAFRAAGFSDYAVDGDVVELRRATGR
jgi:RimJ/RimL family protein N-acetyltransferase